MMRGIIVVITALLSVIFLKRKLYRHHWTAIAFIVLGVAEVGFVAIRAAGSGGEASGSGGSELFGIVLILVAQLFTGAQYVIEEVLLSNYVLDPMLVVGTEGMWGILYYLAVLSPMQLITCGAPYVANPGPLSAMCNDGYLENSAYGFWQMGSRPLLIIYTLGSIVSIAGYNTTGVATTKYASAAARSTIKTACTVLVWILSASLHLQSWEIWSAVGFFFVSGGTFVFNEIIVIPYFGFDQWTAGAIK
jgi:hypothetical protein